MSSAMQYEIVELRASLLQQTVDMVKLNFDIEGYAYDIGEDLARSLRDQHTVVSPDPEAAYYFVLLENHDNNSDVIGLVGIKSVGFSSGVYGLTGLYIHPNKQRCGFGTKLVNYVLKEIILKDGNLCMLSTRKVEFFSRFGFKVMPTGREEWIIMSKLLKKGH